MSRTATAQRPKRSAAIYVRISDDRTGDALGVARQTKVCRDLARSAGYRVVEIFEENDQSAWSGTRSEFERMLDDLQAERFDVVIAWAVDRLGRRQKDVARLAEIIEEIAGVLVTSQEGTIDPATADGAMRLQMMTAMGEFESRRKSERTRAKHRELAERGLPSGGSERPFGFEADRLTIREDEAILIREAYAHLLSGGSLRSLCDDWRARGITATGGTQIKASNLRRVLLSARTAGLREHSGETFEAAWPAIVSREDWTRLRALLTDPSRLRGNKGRTRKYLLTGGFLVCDLCGKRLVSRPRGEGKFRYNCDGDVVSGACGRVSAAGASLDEFVEETVLRLLADEKSLARIRRASTSDDKRAARAADDLAAMTSRRREIAEGLVSGKLSIETASIAEADLDAKIADLQSVLASTSTARTLAELPTTYAALREAWDAKSLEGRRMILATVLDHVTVSRATRGNVFDPTRFEFVWKEV